ncbi:hypothetical protein [Streptomyces populi]|uniref:hypothetical protein n=1 Tax=Streptomyces populi TaxID=2058924 RepID=UPI001F0C4C0E|nr:hypothetical protein [Streptomyces populi]
MGFSAGVSEPPEERAGPLETFGRGRVVAQSRQDDAHVPEGAGLSERVVRPPVQRQRLPVALDRGLVVLEQFLDDTEVWCTVLVQA